MIHFQKFRLRKRKRTTNNTSGNKNQTKGKIQQGQRNLEGGHQWPFFKLKQGYLLKLEMMLTSFLQIQLPIHSVGLCCLSEL